MPKITITVFFIFIKITKTILYFIRFLNTSSRILFHAACTKRIHCIYKEIRREKGDYNTLITNL